jgi:hypothetical protein
MNVRAALLAAFSDRSLLRKERLMFMSSGCKRLRDGRSHD